jgi:glycolate oxidase FAD binding subunit
MSQSISIDGYGPLPVVQPESVAALCDLVKQQRAKREAIYPVGGRTMLDFGLPPTKPGIAVDMTALNRVIDYPARDMTITVQAGITFEKLQATLAQENQWLPLDVPDPEKMTIGGVIACNVSGPRRLGYGTIRDYLLGISFVSDEGLEIKDGGRVVKNVAGYDLMKLHIGALGTVGVITQVTLKVRPLPEKNNIVSLMVKPELWSEWVDLISMTESRPVAVGMQFYSDKVGYYLGFEGSEANVKWQVDRIHQEIKGRSYMAFVMANDNAKPIIQKTVSNQIAQESIFIAMLNMKPSEVSDVLLKISNVNAEIEPLNGVIWIRADQAATIAQCHSFEVRRAPTAWKTPERVFGPPTPAFELMRHIKRTLDPDGVFNPGRMF